MLHFSCDICGTNLAVESSNRYVVKMEASAAKDPAELTDDDLDDDQTEEMARMLSERDDCDDDALEPPPANKKMQFDLCTCCYRKFVADPLGRETFAKFDFSEN